MLQMLLFFFYSLIQSLLGVCHRHRGKAEEEEKQQGQVLDWDLTSLDVSDGSFWTEHALLGAGASETILENRLLCLAAYTPPMFVEK